MNVVYFLCGMLVGLFLVFVAMFASIQIEEYKKQKKYEIAHDRFIQEQRDWILVRQPSDEEIKEMFSNIPETKEDDYSKIFENCEGNVEGGAE